LRDFPVTGYAAAPDGKRIVCSALDSGGSSHLWMAYADRGSPPEQVRLPPSKSEDSPLYARNGDIFFRGSDGAASYLYRIRQAANSPEKVTAKPIVEPQAVSPDSQWVVVQVPLPDQGTSRGVMAYPTEGGVPVHLCRILCFVSWSFDAKTMYVHLLGTSTSNETGKTFAIPLEQGGLFPALPPSGIQSETDLASLHGVKALEGMISPGPNNTQYAFTKQSVHRNLFRVPVP
jgi:hypothetical protein